MRSRFSKSSTNHPTGATSRETAITIGLVVVIAAGVVYAVSSFFSSNPVGAENNELHFQCVTCEKQFQLMSKELGQLTYDHDLLSKHADRTVGMPNCPHCNEKHTGQLMTECPKCHEHFLRDKVNMRTAPEDYVPPPPICPHCNTDIDKYLKENLETD